MILLEPLQVKGIVETQWHTFVIFFDTLVAFYSMIFFIFTTEYALKKLLEHVNDSNNGKENLSM